MTALDDWFMTMVVYILCQWPAMKAKKKVSLLWNGIMEGC